MDKLKNHDYLSQFQDNGKKFIGLETGFTSKSLNRTEFSDIRKSNSYIIINGEIEEFNFPEISEHGGKVVIYNEENPFIDFTPLLNNSLESIEKLISTLIILKNRGLGIDEFSTNLFYKDINGNPIILSPTIVSFLNSRRSFNNSGDTLVKYKSPALSGSESITFAIGVLLYEVITGEYPYNFDSHEELRDNIRRGAIIKPHWVKKNINRELSGFIEDLLTGNCDLTLEDILKKVEALKNSLETDSFSSEDSKAYKRFLFKEKLRKNSIKYRGLLIGAAVALVVVGSFVGTMINNALKPPATAGFTPEQVIEAHFSSIQTLDTGLFDDTRKKSVKKRVATELSSIFVTVQMRGQYEGVKAHYTPQEWNNLPEDEKKHAFVYGINGLELVAISNMEFKVNYEKWVSETNYDNDQQEVFVTSFKEIFTLEETKYSYRISNVETLEEDRVKIW